MSSAWRSASCGFSFGLPTGSHHQAHSTILFYAWFHAVVWVLLGLAALIQGFNLLGGARLAKPVALASLVVYLIFMAAFVTSKKAP